MYIVETNSQLDNFLDVYNKYDSIVLPIWVDSELHPLNNKLSLLFVRIIPKKEDYIICLDHSECEGLDFDLNKLNNDKKHYTFNKKEFNHIIPFKNVIDVNMLVYLKTNVGLELKDNDTSAHHYLKRIYWNRRGVNSLIPIVKHYEKYKEIADAIEEVINYDITELYDIYHRQVIDNLSYIESSGLKVNKELMALDMHKHLTKDDIIYTEYNPYTITGRPSNRFGGINFAALNKDDGSREPFISRFDKGMLIEFDYDAYHLRLIADIIGYKFPNSSVHEYMAKFYGRDVTYDESKTKSFQYLYGGIPRDVIQLNPFFDGVHDYIESKWSEYKSNFSVLSDIYSKRIDSVNLHDMNANKLFNYLIQLTETEANMGVISDIREILEGKESKLVLYSYDSFLFDFNPNDGKGVMKELKIAIERDNIFPTKVKVGENYNNMVGIMGEFSD